MVLPWVLLCLSVISNNIEISSTGTKKHHSPYKNVFCKGKDVSFVPVEEISMLLDITDKQSRTQGRTIIYG